MTVPPPRLVVHEASGRRVVRIDTPHFTIGRRAGNALQLAGTEVSREHAEITRTDEGFLIRDRGSRYGTFVNGERITERLLADGDRVELGRAGAILVFTLREDGLTHMDESASVGDLRQVAALLDTLRAMGTERILDEVLALVLDSAIAATGAERGFIMLADEHDTLELKLARGAGHVTLPATGFATSRKIPEEVFATGRIIAVTDLLEGELAAVHTGTVALGIRHVLCAPLRLIRYVERGDAPARRPNIGVLYLDSRGRGKLLTSTAHASLEALAAEAASAIENARLYGETIEKARLDQELRTAADIQQALLPEPTRHGSFFHAVGASVPSRSVGGDFFDYLDLEDGSFGFALGDVTGKGPPAALLSSMVQGVLAADASSTAGPASLIAQLNRVLLSRRTEARYVTVFFGALSPDGRLTYCNAAQNPPMLFSAAGVRRLDTGGTLVGAFSDAQYAEEVLPLAAGDTLVLFSDGIIEARNEADEEFGDARVASAVAHVIGKAPEAILAALLDAVDDFARGAAQRDDLTAVVVRYDPRPLPSAAVPGRSEPDP